MKKIAFTLFLLFIGTISQAAEISSAADELLEPDKAFAMSTRVVDANTLEASWKIAKGYYMYRDKFKFKVVSGDLILDNPVSPKGIMKKDPTFGNTEIYKKKVVITLPLARTNSKAFTATLRITGQGCNDPIGVCYPPIVKTVKFDLPAAATTKTISSLADLNEALAPDDEVPDFLEPDQAFKVTSLVKDNGKTIIVDFKIAKDYYLYHDKIKIKLKNAGSAKIEKINLPKGKIKDDPYFGKTEVHKKSFQAQVLISGAASDSTMLNVEYQGCAEQGICYAPARKDFPVKAGAGGMSSTTIDSSAVETGNKTASSNAYFLAILGAFITGLLLTFTPCVLPMIPILSGIIVGQGQGQGSKKTSKFRGGGLAAIYVLGTSVTYTVAGYIAGRSGEQLQAHFQNPWAIGVFSLILVLLAMSMFGFYQIQMPSFIQSKMQTHSQKLKGGSFIGVFLLGIISALIVGACVSPLIISALGVAIASQDPTLGGLIMFSMAMGMGVVLIGLGFGADYLLPKAGMWMDRVKHFFGVLLIGVAIYLLGILPGVPVLLLWAALLIITSVYFGATQPLSETATGWRYFWKGVGTILLIWGVLALIGGFGGNRDIMRPISLSGATLMSAGGVAGVPQAAGHVFEKVSTVAELEKHLNEAKAQGKPVILDYFATWCTDCLRMEKSTFADPRVRNIMASRFVAIQVDVTDPNDPESKAIKKRFQVFGPPAMLFFDAQGNEMKDLNFYGYKNADDFLAILEKFN
ncbi:MAG: protein-disulfide reductase DsbD [Acidiferrobacterales bacterium]